MNMRIAGPSYTASMVNQLNQLEVQQYQLQNEAATGQSIQLPSDNPTGMQTALNLQTAYSNSSQYAQNISTLQTQATTVGNAMQQLQTIVEQAGEIATSADGTSSSASLQADAAQVTQLIQQAVQVLNTQNGDQYVFGGTASSQPPFTLTTDANGNVTAVTYNGNTSVTQNQIAENTTIAVDVPGENNTGSGPTGLVSDSRTGTNLFNDLISLQNDLLAGNTTAISSTDGPALTTDQNNIIYQVASNGAIQSRLSLAASAASTNQTSLQESLTNVAGANLTQTLTNLTQTQNAYQAALQTTSSILQLKQYLLEYLP
jgi:flagellar hook-associated protein 3 FlgL